MRAANGSTLQAWVALRADDPEAVSAFAVARTLDSRLTSLRRTRLLEIHGSRSGPAEALSLMHASTQFYNPHKERCTIRERGSGAAALAPGVSWVAVWERGGERRLAAERWWQHETGERVHVYEATVWELSGSPGSDPAVIGADLTLLRDARHGLLCNPWSQEFRILGPNDALPWISTTHGGT